MLFVDDWGGVSGDRQKCRRTKHREHICPKIRPSKGSELHALLNCKHFRKDYAEKIMFRDLEDTKSIFAQWNSQGGLVSYLLSCRWIQSVGIVLLIAFLAF